MLLFFIHQRDVAKEDDSLAFGCGLFSTKAI